MTHELLAAMLGVQRTYLTRILRTLQENGLVSVGRGRITIVDPSEAENAACECHATVKRHFTSVLGAVYGACLVAFTSAGRRATIAFGPHIILGALLPMLADQGMACLGGEAG